MASIISCDTVKNSASAQPNVLLDSSGNVLVNGSIGAAKTISGSSTIAASPIAGTTTATFPARSGNISVDGPAFSAVLSTSSGILTPATITPIVFNTATLDTNSCYSASTGVFTPTVAGYYQLESYVGLYINGPEAATTNPAIFMNNGSSPIAFGQQFVPATAGEFVVLQTSVLLYMNGTTDSAAVLIGSDNLSTSYLYGGYCVFSGTFLRAA